MEQGAQTNKLETPHPVMGMVTVKTAYAALVLGVTAGLAVYVYYIVQWLPYPYQIDFGEGFTVYLGKLFSEGIFRPELWDINQEPYITLMYGPIFPIFEAILIKIFGVSLTIGRALSVGSTLILCGVIYFIVREFTNKKWLAFIVAFLPLCNPIIREWSLMARVEMVGLMFSLLGLYFFIKGNKKTPFLNKWNILSVMCLTLAVYTKQTYLAAPIDILPYLFIHNRRNSFKFLVSLIIPCAALLVFFQIATGGLFINHLINYNLATPYFQELHQLFKDIQIIGVFTIGPICFSLAYCLFRLRERRVDVFTLYFFASFFILAVTLIRRGSFMSYGVEFIVLSMVLSGLFIIEVVQYDWLKSKLRNIRVFLQISLPLLLAFQLLTNVAQEAFPFPTSKYTENCEQVSSIIKDTSEPILTENAGLVLVNNKTPYMEPFVFTNLTLLNIWDNTKYIQDITSQRFDYIVILTPNFAGRTGYGHFTSEAMQAIQDNYKVTFKYNDRYWYGLCVWEQK